MPRSLLWLMLMAVSGVLLFPSATPGQQAQPSSDRSIPGQLPLSGTAQNGSVTTEQATTPGVSGLSVNTLESSIQIQGPFQGSTPTGLATKDPIPLEMGDAIRRGLSYNLGVIG